MLVVFAMKGSLLGLIQEEKYATSVLWDFRERGNINSKLSMIYGARGGIEPPTREC